MPPRYAYWTIILDDAPTSFRTKEREELLPLFNQLRAKNPAAMLKWFSGGRLWDSPEQAKEVRDVEKVRRFREARARDTKEQRELEAREMAAFREQHGRPPDGSDQRVPETSDRRGGASFDSSTRSGPPRATSRGDARQSGPGQHGSTPPEDRGGRPDSEERFRRPGSSAPREGRPPLDRRGKDWRPGGDHRDPRDKYKLPPGESRKRWKDRNLGPRGPKPFGSKPGPERPFGDRPRSDRPYGSKPGGAPSTRGGHDRPIGAGRPRGPKPFGSKPGGPGKFGGKPGAGPRPFGKKPFGGPQSGPPSTHRQTQGRPALGREATRSGGKRPLRPGKPPGGPRRKG